MQLIAEVKTHSPFGFDSPKTWGELFAIANSIGDVVSVHTNPRWNGSLELIKKARKLTDKPILAKGIHANDADIEKALAAGADWVLVVGRIPAKYLDKCWLEPLNLAELKSYPKTARVVWNSRDLKTGGLKKEIFNQARQIFPGWLCQASNIRSIEDIRPKADAVLIGTQLPALAQSLAGFKRLRPASQPDLR